MWSENRSDDRALTGLAGGQRVQTSETAQTETNETTTETKPRPLPYQESVCRSHSRHRRVEGVRGGPVCSWRGRAVVKQNDKQTAGRDDRDSPSGHWCLITQSVEEHLFLLASRHLHPRQCGGSMGSKALIG